MQKVLVINSHHNLMVSLKNLKQIKQIIRHENTYTLPTDIPTKHKLATHNLNINNIVYMYGIHVGKST